MGILMPRSYGSYAKTYGVSAATSGGTTITASGTADVKGSYTEITAATGFAATAIIVSLNKHNTAGRSTVDLSIGAAGSEVVLIPDMQLRDEDTQGANAIYTFPVGIPAGTRLAMRMQSTTASNTLLASVTLLNGGEAVACYSGVDTWGISSSAPSSYLTTNVAANTKSAWQQLTSATARNYKGIVFANTHWINSADAHILVDMAVGGAGTEVVVLENFYTTRDTLDSSATHGSGFIPMDIPAGTRLSWRQQASNTGASNYTDFQVWGVY